MSYHDECGVEEIKGRQWAVTVLIIMMLIVIGVIVFGKSIKKSSGHASIDNSIDSKFKKCFDDDGYIRIDEDKVTAANVNEFYCVIKRSI